MHLSNHSAVAARIRIRSHFWTLRFRLSILVSLISDAIRAVLTSLGQVNRVAWDAVVSEPETADFVFLWTYALADARAGFVCPRYQPPACNACGTGSRSWSQSQAWSCIRGPFHFHPLRAGSFGMHSW